MRNKAVLIIVFIWLILWLNFTARDLFKNRDIYDYINLVKRNAEGKHAYVYGDRFYEFLKSAKTAVPDGKTYKLVGIDGLSLAHRRAVYYLYPLLESGTPDYVLDIDRFILSSSNGDRSYPSVGTGLSSGSIVSGEDLSPLELERPVPSEAILLMLCIAVTGFIGWNVLYLISGRKLNNLYTAEKLGLSCLFGFGVITIQMFIMSLFGIGFTKLGILLPWVVLLAFNAFSILRDSCFRRNDRKDSLYQLPLQIKDIILIAFIGLQTFYNFFRALVKPIESYDAVAIYGLKSKMIYLAGGISGDFFKSVASNFHGAHADYPLLIPLSEAWVYAFLGSFNDIFVKAVFPLFYLSFLFIFYAVLKRITQHRTVSLLFTFALASIKQFSDYSTIAVGDLALGIYFSISVFYLYLWFESKDRSHFFNISLSASILCLWTKNEGALLALLSLSIFLLYLIHSRRQNRALQSADYAGAAQYSAHVGSIINMRDAGRKEILNYLVYALVIVLAFLSWSMFIRHDNLVNENFNFSLLKSSNLTANIGRLPAVLYEYQKQIFGFKKWNIVWILFILLLIKEFKAAFLGDIKYISILLLLFLLGYTLVYILSAVEINFFLSKTFSRFLLHILPVCLFWMALVVDKRGEAHFVKSKGA